MICTGCKREIKDTAKFCPYCGTKNSSLIETISVDSRKNPEMERAQYDRDGYEKNKGRNSYSSDAGQSFQRVENVIVAQENLAPVMGVWSYVGLFLLSSIPIVGLIAIIIFAIDSSNPNKSNYCRAIILIWIICILLVALFWASIVGLLSSM